MFGSQYRVEVAAAILRLDDVWTTLELERQLPDRTIIPWSCVAKELNSLVEIGALVKVPQGYINGRIPYKRGEQLPQFWDLVLEMSTSQEESTPLRIVPQPMLEGQK